jgi:hypothetical protein
LREEWGGAAARVSLEEHGDGNKAFKCKLNSLFVVFEKRENQQKSGSLQRINWISHQFDKADSGAKAIE